MKEISEKIQKYLDEKNYYMVNVGLTTEHHVGYEEEEDDGDAVILLTV